jgi:hypothetical protein
MGLAIHTKIEKKIVSPYIYYKQKKTQKEQEISPITPILEKRKPIISFKFVEAEKIREPQKLLTFVEWLATPSQERSLKTQKELATEIGVNVDTLADWKKLPFFWDEVAIHRNQYFRKYTTSVCYGLVQRAKTGDPRAVELFLSIFENYKKNMRLEEPSVTTHITNEEKAKITHALKNIGLASIIKHNEESESNDNTN